jgi:hypothetical protein
VTVASRWVLTIAFASAVAGCRDEDLVARDTNFVVGGLTAQGSEIIRKSAGKTLVQREGRLVEGGDGVRFLASLDAQGHVVSASFRREGFWGKRYVELRAVPGEPVRYEIMSRGNDEIVALPPGAVVLTDDLPTQAPATAGIVRVDLEHAALQESARPAGATDPVEARHTAREPFVETTAKVVVDWCKQQSAHKDPVIAAREIADAVKPKLAPDRRHGAPSAMNTATYGGYDQGGAALVVACLRVLGHPARIVAGTVDGGSAPAGVKVARAWSQVHDGTRWRDVDPLETRGTDGEPAGAHHALHEGLPRAPIASAP